MTTRELGWRTWLWIALGTNAVLLLVWAGQRCFGGELRALVASVPDDSFYYVLPAFRFWKNGFWTFDGEHPTFGVQPAYAWFLTLLAGFFEDRFTFFRAALWTNYVLFAAIAAAVAGFLYRLLRPCGAFRAGLAAVVGAHGFLLNGTLLHGYTTLKETSLYALLLVLSLWQAHRSRPDGSRRALLSCGILVGLALSCRITPSTLLIAGTTALFAAEGWRAKRLLALGGGLAMAVVPWAVHALVVHGRLLPTSGAIKVQPFFEALRSGKLDEQAPALLAAVGPYLRDVFAYSLGQPNPFQLHQGAPPPSVLTTVFPLLLLGLLFVRRRDHALRACPGAWIVPAVIVAATVGTALNPVFLGVERMYEVRHYYAWYIADLPVLLAMLAPIAVCLVGARAEGARRARGEFLLAPVVSVGLVLAGVQTLRPLRAPAEFHPRPDAWNTQIVAMAERVNELLEPGERIGAYNAGMMGFLTEATVINFDGLANDDILRARSRGRTIFEYVQANDIRYLVDPLRPTGWFGNPFDRVQIVAAVPFRLDSPRREYYDGYFLLRVADERFPDFEPRVDEGGVRVVPWDPADPLGSTNDAVRCFRFQPTGGRAVATFHTLRAFEAMDFQHGCAPPTDDAPAPILSVRDEAGKLLYRSQSARPEHASFSCRGADLLEVEVAWTGQANTSVPVTWLAGVSFEAEPPASPVSGEERFQAYGGGCNAREQSTPLLPHLEVDDAGTGKLRYRCTNAPPLAAGTLAIGSKPLSQLLPGGCRGLVERTASTILIQLRTDEEGTGTLEVELPEDSPSGFFYAQVVFRDPQDAHRFDATTNGVRILLP